MTINHNWIRPCSVFLLLPLLLTITNGVETIRLTEISVPEVVDVKEKVNLTCTYHMGGHKLNSVKWYKDGMEFFRYAPMMTPAFLNFPAVGVSLITDQTYICNSHTCTISLGQLEARTSGTYRCEVSGDAPEFKLDSRTANMTIASLPRYDPLIIGLADYYEIGDFLSANCTTDRSSPAATITWFINGEAVHSDYPQNPYFEETVDVDGFLLQMRTSELHFQLDPQRHQLSTSTRNRLELRCNSRVEGLPTVPQRDTIRIVHWREDVITNQKREMTYTNSGTGSKCVQFFTLNSFVTILSAVMAHLVALCQRTTQLS